jgi:hypothetical protein
MTVLALNVRMPCLFTLMVLVLESARRSGLH